MGPGSQRGPLSADHIHEAPGTETRNALVHEGAGWDNEGKGNGVPLRLFLFSLLLLTIVFQHNRARTRTTTNERNQTATRTNKGGCTRHRRAGTSMGEQ